MTYVRAGAAVVVAFGFQTLLAPPLLAAGLAPDFLLATAAAVGMSAGPGAAIGFGLFAGLLQDSFSGALLGLNGFSKTLAAYGAARGREHPPLDAAAGVPVLLLFAAVADVAILWVLGEVAGFQSLPGRESGREFGRATLGIPVTVLYGAVVFRLLRPRPALHRSR